MESAQIRQKFLSYFEERGHAIVPSSSLVPAQDPTLLFTNAGMVPFKDAFLGIERRPYTRAASVQKCLRVSGKHNDLEEVGPSPQHHTFFEMLGNFSFGDYFKEEAIAFAWELLTKGFGLPADVLHPTVFEEDDESAEIWSRVKGLPASEVVRLGAEHNFWSMGDTGPCGPNSEIIYDRTGRCLTDGSDCHLTCECGRWWELWNLVFMQFDRAADGTLTPLAQHGVDTGMGFERLAAILQGVETNYETDLFVPLIKQLQIQCGDADPIPRERLPSYRAVADHARAVSFLIADGLVPSNEGRGYVLRRILRRASYQGNLLGLDRPFLSQICEGVIEIMGGAYPELTESAGRIADLVSDEEERFLSTLEAGLTRLEAVLVGEAKVTARGTVLPGEEAFRLYDTYGFPIDLTRKVLEARGWSVDEQGFNEALDAQRQRARSARELERGQEEALLSQVGGLPATRFFGYETLAVEARLEALFVGEQRAETASAGAVVAVVLDTTPFYAEAGGQVGDSGRIVGPKGEIEISAVHSIGQGVYLHHGQVVRGDVREGEQVHAEVDEQSRRATMRNHTATHLLHRALRVVLGQQAKQAGSLVAPDRLRFDFFHNKPLTDEELRDVERIVREQVLLDRPVRTEVLPIQQALDLGADAMFDEKYGQEARVVSVGDGDAFSRELCGGTHCRATGEIGAFLIIDQRSVGAGVRRVDALTGTGAFAWMDTRRQVVEQLSREYNVPPEELLERLRALSATGGRARELPKPAAANLPDPDEVLSRAEKRDGTYLVVDWIDNVDAATLREFGDELRRRVKSAAVVLGSLFDGKLNVAVMLTDDLVKKGLHAGKLADQIGKEMGAGGGGRPDMGTAGGDPERRQAGLALARELLRSQR
ncbi:MAG: alanine--tRNA ligase [Chloroflexi bacterium RBG_16_68_14]|nr:MAG: alanine--tRNA ligase [Chloroflexi bacterium RBG_16_68_14]